ncbi:MAG: hypothetical protein WAO95_18920 [Burkholderiales bacterium]
MDEPASTPLLTDLYQLSMIEAYLDHGETGPAVFEFFVRKLPERRGFLVAAGLEQALEFLEGLRFSEQEIGWLARSGRFRAKLLERLAALRFTGDVHAMPEGTVFFVGEPILRVTAPLPEAQLVETRLINILHFQSLIAAKAARMRLAAPDKLLVDFGLRRAHGAEAGLMAARASYIAIFASDGLDEDGIAAMLAAGAPVDGFGVGTSLTTSSDAPALDCAYKLQEYAGLPRRKRSAGKATWPGRKQVWRRYGDDGRMAADTLSVESDTQPGEPLIVPVMRAGRRLAPAPSLADIRARAARNLLQLPEPLRRLQGGVQYPVQVAAALVQLAAEVDRRIARQEARPS